MRTILFAVAALLLAQVGCRAAPADMSSRCAHFQAERLHWPDPSTRLLDANWRSQGWNLSNPMGPPLQLPEHCEVSGILQERLGSDGQHYAIRFRMRLPARWNGRFLFEGGGGTEGVLGLTVGVITPGATTALDRGYAVVS